MANRTIQFLGNGHAPTGTDPITVTATLNGTVVYTGTIPTSYTSEIGHLPTDQVVLFTCELPVDFSGTVPMSTSISSPVSATVFFQKIQSNYMLVNNPVYTPSQLAILQNSATTIAEKIEIYTAVTATPLSEAEITILETGTDAEVKAVLTAHNLRLAVSSGTNTFVNINGNIEPRTNVVINEVPVTRQTEPAGTWGWVVESLTEGDSTFACDVTFLAGQE
jgi:hypothetical protein